MGSAREQLLFDLLKALPLFDHPRRLHHLHPLAERGGVGVDGQDPALGIALFQLARGDDRRMRRAADAAGHTDIEHIVARGERTLKVFLDQRRADHRRFDDRALAHRAVEGRAVKIRIVGIVRRLSVHRVGKRDDRDVVLLRQRDRQIGRCIGK